MDIKNIDEQIKQLQKEKELQVLNQQQEKYKLNEEELVKFREYQIFLKVHKENNLDFGGNYENIIRGMIRVLKIITKNGTIESKTYNGNQSYSVFDIQDKKDIYLGNFTMSKTRIIFENGIREEFINCKEENIFELQQKFLKLIKE